MAAGRRSAIAGFARTSPGGLSLITLSLMVLSVLAGVVLSSTASSQTAQLSALTARTEPLTAAAQDLYSALSEADATAASAFLAGGLEPPDLRERYARSIDTAAAALGTAGAGERTDPGSQSALNRLATRLPVYTGLVEAARANNQQGFPVGAAYLREASAMMQSTLLPAADQLYQNYSMASARQSQIARLPWLGLVLGLLAVSALVTAQLYVRRRTRRMLNVGLLVSSLALVLALVWACVATTVAANRLNTGRSEGAGPLAALAQSRILAQQARADETLMLVARSDSAGYEKSFADTTATLLDRLTGQSDEAARNAAQGWVAAHQRVTKANDSGNYQGAVSVALGNAAQDSAAQFAALDAALRAGITDARALLRDQASAAQSVLGGLSPGTLALSLLAAASVAAGMWPRLREYQ